MINHLFRNLLTRPVVIYVLIFGIFFYRDFRYTYLQSDFIAYWLPHYKYMFESFKVGELPFWQPYSFLGLPELFKLELAVFHPFFWLLFLLNLVFNNSLALTFLGKSMEFTQYLNMLIGALGMYKILTRTFRLSHFSALFGGLVFTLSIHSTAEIFNLSTLPGKLYLPWIFFFLWRFLEKRTPTNYLILVLVNYILLTLGYPYHWVYFFITQVLFSLTYGKREAIHTSFAIINAIFLAGFFLLPNYHILTQSQRGIGVIDNVDALFHLRNAFVPTRIVNILNPFIFQGLYNMQDKAGLFSTNTLNWGTFPLMCLVIGFVSMKIDKLTRFIVLLFFGGLILSLGGYLDVSGIVGAVAPFFLTLRSHAQALGLTFFSGTIIIAIGFENIVRGGFYKKTFFFFCQLVLLLFTLLLFTAYRCDSCTADIYDSAVSQSRALLLTTTGLIMIHLYGRSLQRSWLILAIFVTLLEYSFYNTSLHHLHSKVSYTKYFSGKSLFIEEPKNTNLFRYMFANHQYMHNTSMHNIASTQGYETVPYSGYYLLLDAKEIDFLKRTNTKYLITTEATKETQSSDFKLVKVIAPSDHLDESYFNLAKNGIYLTPQNNEAYYVYEIKNYLPRFYVPKRLQECPQKQCKSVDPINTSYVANLEKNFTNTDSTTTKINVVDYKSNSLTMVIESKANSFVASSEIHDPGWSASSKGAPIKIYRTNEGFRGFFVPPGKNVVIMSYYPPYLSVGIAISGASLIGLLWYSFRERTAS